jgi:phosphoenolpyruvate carboxykinase (GTP)
VKRLPRIFHVNWFRQDRKGKFLWPGFGDNLRVLRWIIDRCNDRLPARETPVGLLPRAGDIDISGLKVSPEAMHELLHIEPALWQQEIENIGEYLRGFGDRLPKQLLEQLAQVEKRLEAAEPS